MSFDFYKNAVVTDGVRTLRILEADSMQRRAAVIELSDKSALPEQVHLSDLEVFQKKELPPATKERVLSAAQIAVCDKAWDALAPIVMGGPGQIYRLCDPRYRAAALREAASRSGLSDRSLYKYLRRYCQRGQDRLALLGDFDRCGQRDIPGTARRGRKSEDHETYQLGSDDEANMRRIVDRYYKHDERRGITNAFNELLAQHYSYTDGNDEPFHKEPGQRPSRRQFENFIRRAFKLGEVFIARVGGKEFGRNYRAKLSTAVKHCQGVGHQYDIDATVLDLYAVFGGDRKRIIGKPTLYLIVDRKSRLIVGFFLGLEKASYMAAVEAMVSIAEDKQALCEDLGVPYDPNDWPADQVFPIEFIADRAELLSHAARAVANRMSINVGLTEALRPDRKPFGENGFRLTGVAMQAEVPGFDPEKNAKKRRKKGYEKDACLTLREIKAALLIVIIMLNKRPMKKYPRSAEQRLKGLEPSAIGVWNEGVSRHMGQLSRYTADEARNRLWPIGEASLDEFGLHFRNCVYDCQDPRFPAWCAEARRTSTRKVEILYTRACVDRIYLRVPGGKGGWLEATLSDRTPSDYRGLSFAEVDAIEKISARDWRTQHAERRTEVELEAKRRFAKLVEQPVMEHAANGPLSRSYRREDTAADRQAELRRERQRTGRLTDEERALSEPKKVVLHVESSDGGVRHADAAAAVSNHAPRSPTTEAVRSFYNECMSERDETTTSK